MQEKKNCRGNIDKFFYKSTISKSQLIYGYNYH